MINGERSSGIIKVIMDSRIKARTTMIEGGGKALHITSLNLIQELQKMNEIIKTKATKDDLTKLNADILKLTNEIKQFTQEIEGGESQ